MSASLNQHSYVRVRFQWSNQKKTQKLAESYCCACNIYLWLQALWSSQTEKNNYIWNCIMISNIFEYQYNVIVISLWFLQTKNLNWIRKKKFLTGGGVADNGNGNWCRMGRAFLRLTGHFGVESCTFVSNRAFWCWTRFLVSNECYNAVLDAHTAHGVAL